MNKSTNRSVMVEKGLEIHLRKKRAKECLRWGIVNLAILLILLFDISNKCPYTFSKWFYLEYAITTIFALSVFVYFVKYFYYTFSYDPIRGTKEQKDLLQFEDGDNSFIEQSESPKKTIKETPTPINATLLSWHSSFNDSNRSIPSPNWMYTRNASNRSASFGTDQNTSWNGSGNESSFNVSQNPSFNSRYNEFTTNNEMIVDEKGLQKFLKLESSKEEYLNKETNTIFGSPTINSFWNQASNVWNAALKTTHYQLAPETNTAPVGAPTKSDENRSFGISSMDLDGSSEILRNISSSKLSQYVANLRMWISSTILHRLTEEMDKTNAAFKACGFSDLQIGSVGLERLRKATENPIVAPHVLALPLLVNFLDLSSNQEYIVQRIKDLAKGSCIADYRWDSGGSYYGLSWDEHLPTDSAILFHIICTYLDSQLMPLPQPGGRPFFNRYVVNGDKKSPKEQLAEVKNKPKCSILCVNRMKPKFNFISDEKIHNCANDRNNLFYAIIQFVIYMKTRNGGSLEGVNLGKSGINMLCIIDG